MVKKLKNESGYSLVEVMVAIMLLTIAIIPMVGMFDAGLRAATQSSNYDKARALANKQMETAKNLPYTAPLPAASVRNNFPSGTGAPDPFSGVITSPDQTDTDFPGATYTVRKAYVRSGTTEVVEDANVGTMMQVTVTVTWGSGNSYSTIGLVSK